MRVVTSNKLFIIRSYFVKTTGTFETEYTCIYILTLWFLLFCTLCLHNLTGFVFLMELSYITTEFEDSAGLRDNESLLTEIIQPECLLQLILKVDILLL